MTQTRVQNGCCDIIDGSLTRSSCFMSSRVDSDKANERTPVAARSIKDYKGAKNLSRICRDRGHVTDAWPRTGIWHFHSSTSLNLGRQQQFVSPLHVCSPSKRSSEAIPTTVDGARLIIRETFATSQSIQAIVNTFWKLRLIWCWLFDSEMTSAPVSLTDRPVSELHH